MEKEGIILIVVGDIIINRDDPKTIFAHVVDVLRSGDIRFANCDQMYSDLGYPNPVHATYSDPSNISALTYAGLDVVSLANNHTLDWGPEALLDSIARLRKAGIAVVGAGKNIREARQPVIIEKKGNKVGFLAYGCIGPKGYEAEENKPGYAPMRAYTIYEQVDYQPGHHPKVVTVAYPDDLAAMERDVRQLRGQVDAVAVSFHWGLHNIPALIPKYEFEVAYAAINAGASIILGGHPHILKGIEVYKGKVIFHSLSNFATELPPRGRFQAESVERTKKAHQERFNFGVDPEYPTFLFHPEAKATLIGKVAIQGGEINKVSYIPCYINKMAEPEIVTRGNPHGKEVFSYVEKISCGQNLASNFAWEGDEVVISG